MKDINKCVDEHFEWQRIHDLKIDIDAVLEEIKRNLPKKCKPLSFHDCAGCRAHRLYKDLKWFKKLL